MIVKSKIRPVNSEGIKEFKIKKTIKLPIFSALESHRNTSTTFLKDGTVKGEIVKAEVHAANPEGKLKPVFNGEGLGIMSEGGYYLVPLDYVTWNSDTWQDPQSTEKSPAGEIVQNMTEQFQFPDTQKFPAPKDEKTILGLTYKQLFAIVAISFIINKLS